MYQDLPLTLAIPTYNRAESVYSLVQSLLPQLRPVDELIVIDDCSPDNTSELMKEFGNIHYHKHFVNQGMVRNWNSCFQLAKNDWICIIHDDDIVSDNAVAILRKTCSVVGKPALIAQPSSIVTPSGDYHYHVYEPGHAAVRASALSPSGALVHRAIYDALGGFAVKFAYSADVEYFARIAAHYDLVIIESPAVVTYQLHESNYQYTTWLKPDFWSQWREITYSVLSYAGLEESALSEAYNKQLAATLRYIMETGSKKKDKAILRKYGKIALSRPEYGKRLRLKGLIAATLGSYV